MKYCFLYIISISIILFACNPQKGESELDINSNKCTRYACPVHLDKTSVTLEKCPVCNTPMVLIPDSLKKDSLNHTIK